jgi:ubiquinone/menaquinone biosynthesis C-methylase UbiE
MSIADVQAVRDTLVERPDQFWRRPEIAEGYDRGRFDDLWGRLYRRREEHMIADALRGLAAGASVLDAACGTGRITALLQQQGFRAVGCDISPAMMAVADRRLSSLGYHTSFVQSSVEGLPYDDRSFDAVTCIGLLMHLDPDMRVRALRELARVSRGPIIAQYGCLDTFQRLTARIRGVPAGQVRYPVSMAELKADLSYSGLQPTSISWVLRGVSSSVIVVLASARRAAS